ncbi:hypothetical protein H2136_10315 [Aeromonas hydrophila]|uniref:Ribose/galactose/methyl galactoside import ATP-binding protein n=1 Tax=Aeromonas hydrophila TaxID=644 RepID=A0A926FNL5_AERHY|nr:hypothetical protein [Aeromonas hydrophila]
MANHNAHEAIRNGFALVTEERRSTGIYSRLDIAFNSLIANMDNYKGSMGLLSDNKMKSDTQWVIDSMRVKTPTQQTQIGSSRGQPAEGDHRPLAADPAGDPDAGRTDSRHRRGAKFEIYQLILELAKKDKGIIIISSEMPELLGITDRIMVMSNGRVAGIVNTKETDQSEILRLASLYL